MIRKATLDDVASINKIYNHEVINTTVTFDTQPRDESAGIKWFLAHNDSNHPIFVAVIEDLVVGYCSLSPYRFLDAYAQTVEISLYVHKDFRKQGIGRELCRYVLDYAKNRDDIHNIIAVITTDNDKSINLFKSFDFEDGGTIPQTGKKFGKLLSITNLYKII
ncbi:phosphinothricin acetyltransferase [Succinivibrio dextrinosolvens DSM 3072]|uniref:Phosphinothricin acetyltransferase n=1 Tax=Succinivibrio dextrinosolvens DSM 3072 TaxID=1123324 RepID=A0A1T4W0Q3_9GAMM|nr:GNAT family N-acetyltransferase [Succinivibrio dextrinosolvens]SKA70854.1 phosphinothricin acetyltransferase [Succinivibrio dextrinosolvens DSM 3072]